MQMSGDLVTIAKAIQLDAIAMESIAGSSNQVS